MKMDVMPVEMVTPIFEQACSAHEVSPTIKSYFLLIVKKKSWKTSAFLDIK